MMRDLATTYLKLALADSRLTLPELSAKSGINYKTVCGIFAGRRKYGPRVETLAALLEACGWELSMEKKNATTQTPSGDGAIRTDAEDRDRNAFLTARGEK